MNNTKIDVRLVYRFYSHFRLIIEKGLFYSIKVYVLLLTLSCVLMPQKGLAQEKDGSGQLTFRGNTSITQNGISLIPSFSLNDPALLFDLKFAKDRLSFEPDMRFALRGKPWSFIFWLRYKAIQKERFSLRVGAHPALNFRTINVLRNGTSEELLESRRYIAGELAPSFKISDRVSVGIYYLHGRGFDDGVKQTNFVTFNSSFKKLYISQQFYFNISPQVYYLRTDDLVGYYVNGLIELAKDGFPLSITSLLNKALDTEIVPEDDFIWNISLVYTF